MAFPRSDGATVKRVGAGRSPWRVQWYAGEGADRKATTRWCATEGEARAIEAAIEAGLRRPVLPAAAPAPVTKAGTFGAFAAQWLDTVVSRKKPGTVRSYRQLMANHILPTLGRVPLTDRALGVQAIVDVMAARQKAGVSWGTQKCILRVISTACQWAKRTGHLSINPCDRLLMELRDGTSGADDPEPNPLTQAQADAFLAWLEARAPVWVPYFLTLLHTGMRRGEASALRWSLIDFAKRRALLKFNYSPAAKGDITLKGKRPHEIDLSRDVVEALRGVQERIKVVDLDGRPASPYVFLTARGARVLPKGGVDRICARAMRAIGAEGHTMHDLRDTFATLHLLADPGRLLWVSWMLGHRHTSTTLDRYARWIPTQVGGATYADAFNRPAAALRQAEQA